MTAKTVCTNLLHAKVGDYIQIAYPSGNECFAQITKVGKGYFVAKERRYTVQATDFATSSDLSDTTAYACFEGQEDEL